MKAVEEWNQLMQGERTWKAPGASAVHTLNRISERGVEVVDHLGETASWVFLSILIQDVHLDSPLFHRKAFLDRRLITR